MSSTQKKTNKLKPTNYINIQGWMYNLGLDDIKEILTYAVVYGFSQDGEGDFHGSLEYLASILCSHVNTACAKLKSLTDSGLIIKNEEMQGSVKICKYKVNEEKISLAKNSTITKNDIAQKPAITKTVMAITKTVMAKPSTITKIVNNNKGDYIKQNNIINKDSASALGEDTSREQIAESSCFEDSLRKRTSSKSPTQKAGQVLVSKTPSTLEEKGLREVDVNTAVSVRNAPSAKVKQCASKAAARIYSDIKVQLARGAKTAPDNQRDYFIEQAFAWKNARKPLLEGLQRMIDATDVKTTEYAVKDSFGTTYERDGETRSTNVVVLLTNVDPEVGISILTSKIKPDHKLKLLDD